MENDIFTGLKEAKYAVPTIETLPIGTMFAAIAGKIYPEMTRGSKETALVLAKLPSGNPEPLNVRLNQKLVAIITDGNVARIDATEKGIKLTTLVKAA